MVEGSVEANAFTSMLPRLDPSRANGVAEPCRVLDFPNAVSGATSRLLNSIIQKGPHHGVHPIIMVDTDIPLPYGFNLHELEQHATTLAWDGRRFVWNDRRSSRAGSSWTSRHVAGWRRRSFRASSSRFCERPDPQTVYFTVTTAPA